MADEATRHGQIMGLTSRIHAPPGAPPPAYGPATGGIDRALPHLAQVNHQPAIADGEASEVVASPTHGKLQPLATAELDGLGDLLSARAARDHRGAAVDSAVPD